MVFWLENATVVEQDDPPAHFNMTVLGEQPGLARRSIPADSIVMRRSNRLLGNSGLDLLRGKDCGRREENLRLILGSTDKLDNLGAWKGQ